MTVAVIDLGIGNFGSVANMVRRVGGNVVITADAGEIAAADRIILPGVGSFDAAMHRMQERQIMPVLKQRVAAGVPLLGICLGMQLLGTGSDEGELPGLGLVPGRVIRFGLHAETGEEIRVPHIGWNALTGCRGSRLLAGMGDGTEFYFVHSFHFDSEVAPALVASADYGGPFPAVIESGSLFGVQFHPEKSQEPGQRLFHNFLHGLGHA